MEEAKHFIAGEWALPAQLETIAVVDPSDGQPFASIARGTAPDIERAVAAARDAFAGPWGAASAAERGRVLMRLSARVAASIEELADIIDVEHISEYLYTKGQPDPDLVIRTSGEQRISGFLMWQSAHTEFYFCEAYWPDFRRVDFLRALRAYGERHRRYGG